jgi:hypothetical protein
VIQMSNEKNQNKRLVRENNCDTYTKMNSHVVLASLGSLSSIRKGAVNLPIYSSQSTVDLTR